MTQGNGNFRLTYGNTTLQSDVVRFSSNPLTMTANIQNALDSMFGAGNTVVTPVCKGRPPANTASPLFVIWPTPTCGRSA